MNLVIVADEKELGEKAASLVCDFVNQKPSATLVFPTGNSPLPMFKALVRLYQAGRVSFAAATLVELDDYAGIALTDRRNLFTWLQNTFIKLVDLRPDQTFRFNSEAADAQVEALRMDALLQAHGGIDLLVLGLGPNGHIGFNEPGSAFSSPTRVITLTSESIRSNARYWGGEQYVPRQGFTLGMGVLRQAKATILLVNGSHKARILKTMLEGPITEHLPATCLREMPNVTIIADKAAAGQLKELSL